MRCGFCKQYKQDSEFYSSNKTTCKECVKANVRANRIGKIDYYRQYDRLRASMPHRVALATKIHQRWKATHPNRRKAQVAVNNAVRDGRLAKLPCFVCGVEAEAHHPDYSAPLDVVWLCSVHHKAAHSIVRKAA